MGEPVAVAEGEFDPTDPYNRSAQTFPTLSEAMAKRVARHGTEEAVPAGTYLFERGQRSVDFFLVLDGEIEILDHDEHGLVHFVHVHGPRQFTGELDLFNDRAILVSGRARGESRVVRVSRKAFRAMIASEPDIGEIIMRAFILRRVALIRHAQGGVELVGPGHSGDTLRIQRFLTRNGYPHRLLDTERDEDAGEFLQCFELTEDQLPVLVLPGEELLRNPSNAELADALGISEEIDSETPFDVAVVGAGPAGLAAAVYAASEGLRTVVIEAMAPGGQAGTSSKIENYLGFPTGISGQALAGRAMIQAQKFGARLAIGRPVKAINCEGAPFRLELEDDRRITARSIVVATGAAYRKLDLPDYEKFEGQGIHYAATAMEAGLCSNEEVVVVGGGNSAGQAAVFLASHAAHVHLMVRSDGLAATMSDYLVERIEHSKHITLHTHTELTELSGDSLLREVEWTNRKSGEKTRKPIGNVFVMIGAAPNTEWMNGCVDCDGKGFICTGFDGQPFGTSRPGIFAVGDVRAASVKRVASGVGEGSVVVSSIHKWLADHPA